MIDSKLAVLALRNRAIGTTVATTGSATLTATSTGYTRAAGSFVTDGFEVGMEVTPTGFTQTTRGIISEVSALTMLIRGGRTAQASGAGRTLSVSLPETCAWEGVDTEPVAGKPYLEEAWVPATSRIVTFPANGGLVEETGLYVLRWYGLAGVGHEALRACVEAVMARFTPGTSFTLSDGSKVHVRTDTGPSAGQIQRVDGGWLVLTLTVPWLGRSTNQVAA